MEATEAERYLIGKYFYIVIDLIARYIKEGSIIDTGRK